MSATLKQLRIFLAVAHNQNLTQAADKLCLSKPAVSLALKALEEQLGRPVFDRLPGRLALNSNGQKLLPLADELLARSQTLSSLFEQDSLQGTLRIGASRTIGSYLLPHLIADFQQQTGHLQQQIAIHNSHSICQQLQHYQLDVGLIEARIQQPDLLQIPWGHDQMCVLTAPGHPLAQQGALTAAQLSGQRWLLREPGSGSRQLFQQKLAPHLDSWLEALTLSDTQALINCCAAGLGLTCVSKRAAASAINSGQVIALELPLKLTRPLFLVYPKGKYHSPLLQAFLLHCQQNEP